jgi:hypothetical protein
VYYKEANDETTRDIMVLWGSSLLGMDLEQHVALVQREVGDEVFSKIRL